MFHINGELFYATDADDFADILTEKLGWEAAEAFRYFIKDAAFEMQEHIYYKFVEAAKDAIDDLDLEGLI